MVKCTLECSPLGTIKTWGGAWMHTTMQINSLNTPRAIISVRMGVVRCTKSCRTPPLSWGHVNQGVLKCTYLSRWAPSNQLYQFTWGWWGTQRHAEPLHPTPLFWEHIYLEGALMHRAKQISTPKSIVSVCWGVMLCKEPCRNFPPFGRHVPKSILLCSWVSLNKTEIS